MKKVNLRKIHYFPNAIYLCFNIHNNKLWCHVPV